MNLTTNPTFLASLFTDSWTKNTSYDPKGWSVRNRAWGQCLVTALVIQDYLGGEIIRGRINGYRHYWNLLPDSTELDLTRQQFGAITSVEPALKVSRKALLSFQPTAQRYQKLLIRVKAASKKTKITGRPKYET